MSRDRCYNFLGWLHALRHYWSLITLSLILSEVECWREVSWFKRRRLRKMHFVFFDQALWLHVTETWIFWVISIRLWFASGDELVSIMSVWIQMSCLTWQVNIKPKMRSLNCFSLASHSHKCSEKSLSISRDEIGSVKTWERLCQFSGFCLGHTFRPGPSETKRMTAENIETYELGKLLTRIRFSHARKWFLQNC